MVVEPSARFEEVKIPLPEPVHDLEAVTGVIGIPEWWPSGQRVGVVLGSGLSGKAGDPLMETLHRQLTERKYLTIRFNFPYVEAGRKRPDPVPVLRQTFRAAVATLGNDPTSAPAHVFLGGSGIGARAATHVAPDRLRIDGIFCLGFPLHPAGKPGDTRAEQLFRIVTPMLFVQGDRSRFADLDVLRRTLARVGAPTQLHVVHEADHTFRVPKKSSRTEEDVQQEVLATLEGWFQKVLGV